MLNIYLLVPSMILLLNLKNKLVEKIKNASIISLYIIIPAFLNNSVDAFVLGNDIYVYKISYLKYLQKDEFYIASKRRDVLFGAISKTIALFKASTFSYFLIISIIQVIPIYYFMKKYSKNWKLSFFLYILIFYKVFHLNILRQGIVLSLSFIFLDLIIEKKKVKSLILLVFLFLIHRSAIVLLILLFINGIKLKYSSYLLGTISVASILLGSQINSVMKKVLEVLSPQQYQHYFSSDNFFTDYRMTMNYTLYLIFLCMIIIFLLKVAKKNELNCIDHIFLKISYIGFIILLFTSSMVILRRLNDYFLVYLVVSMVNISYYSKYRQIFNLISILGLIIIFML